MEDLLDVSIVALLEHEGRHSEASKLFGIFKRISVFLHGVADEDPEHLRFALGMGEDFADLGVSHAAIDALHQPGEMLGLRNPLRCSAFIEPAVVDQLDGEPADRFDFLEHFGLQLAGHIPG